MGGQVRHIQDFDLPRFRFQPNSEFTFFAALERDQFVRHIAHGEVHARAVFACLFMRKVVLLVAMPQKFFSLSGSRIFLWKYM